MKDTILNGVREVWVDNVKVVACVLVVLGHFLPSLVAANILPNYFVLQWFKQTIYYFHVPLFFICSGYLYQKHVQDGTVECWKMHVLKKALALGVPYVTFSAITWGLKTIAVNSVNNEINTGLFETLFLRPTAPYWYLYTLFLIFLITPTFHNRRMMAWGLGIALVFRVLNNIDVGYNIYALSTIFANEVWFVIGMWLHIIDFRAIQKNKSCLYISLAFATVFGGTSIMIFNEKLDDKGLEFLMGIMACMAIVLFIAYVFRDNMPPKVFEFLSKYTFPIFLLHTICAAPVRIVLIKIGIVNVFVHIVVGIMASFIVPVVIAKIAEHFKWMNFFMYPTKYIKIFERIAE